MDRLAKKVAPLPLPDIPPTGVWQIYVGGGPAPTPAKKWIPRRRMWPKFTGAHWVSWLPLKGGRQAYWLQWLWGNIRWDGCEAPWSKDKVPCLLCRTTHLGLVHDKFYHMPNMVSNIHRPPVILMGRLAPPCREVASAGRRI